MSICICGCGQQTKISGNTYKQGHNPRVSNISEWDCFMTISAADINSYIDYEENPVIDLRLSPEEILLKKESYNRLSEEAKYVIGICLNTPAELLDLITTPVYRKISKEKLTKYFRKMWNQKKVNRVFREIQNLVNI